MYWLDAPHGCRGRGGFASDSPPRHHLPSAPTEWSDQPPRGHCGCPPLHPGPFPGKMNECSFILNQPPAGKRMWLGCNFLPPAVKGRAA